MEPKFIISEVFSTAWKGTKSQLWILAGLLIGYCILSFTLTAFAMPMQSSIIGKIIVNVISALFSIIFSLGYMKNIFQALDGEEPQFSAYGQQTKNIITYFLASLITVFVVLAGFYFLSSPVFIWHCAFSSSKPLLSRKTLELSSLCIKAGR